MSRTSRGELERRWSLVRAFLAERDIDALVAVGSAADFSGYVRWLTDGPIAYRKLVACFRDDWMTVVDHGPAGRIRTADGDDPDHPGAGEIVTVSEFPSVGYTARYGADALVASLRRRGVRSVALAAPNAMTADVLACLTEGMPGVAVHDATDVLDLAKAVKSAEEIGHIRAAATLQDAVFAATAAFVRPGLRDFEVAAFAEYEARRRGGGHGVFLCGSAAAGEPAFMRPAEFGNRVIAPGDLLTLLIENGSPDGYFCELGRNLSVGPVPADMAALHRTAVEAQAYSLSLLTPGASARDVYAAHNAFMTERGLPPESRLYAHGQGYDLIERPLIRDDEPMTIREGMCLAVHPAAIGGGRFGFVCDNVVIERSGATRLHATPQEIFEVDA